MAPNNTPSCQSDPDWWFAEQATEEIQVLLTGDFPRPLCLTEHTDNDQACLTLNGSSISFSTMDILSKKHVPSDMRAPIRRVAGRCAFFPLFCFVLPLRTWRCEQ